MGRDVVTCLARAADYLKQWPAGGPAVLAHAALELRLALELYLLARVEEITGRPPAVDGREPLEVLDEALALHDEAMTPQAWSVGVEEDLRENPATAARSGFAILTVRKARTFYPLLSELLHGTVHYQPRAEQLAFWDKQAAQLANIHGELSEICLGIGGAARRGPLPETGTQGAVL